jgi:uncharacterized protein
VIDQTKILDTLKQTDSNLGKRFEQEVNLLKKRGSVLVALSGGVDSSIVALASVLALGKDAHSITFNSVLSPAQEIFDAKRIAQEIGIAHETINLDIMKNQSIVNNETDRCYFCKTYLIGELKKYQKTHKLEAIVEGTNISDLNDYRPGIKALKENDIISPHIEVGMTKSMIRKIANTLDLSIAEKPSASCLATRIPYGDPLEISRLERIGKAEEILSGILPPTQIRVRDHKEIARIELSPKAFAFAVKDNIRNKIVDSLTKLGYKHILLDLRGYGIPEPKD